jgi:hypothetical protein
MGKKYFTLAEANELLPAISEQLNELQDIKRQFEQKYIELRGLKLLHRYHEQPQESDPYFLRECELEFLQIQFQSGISSLETRGVEVKDIELGLVDFPAMLNGEEVLLCWKQGEDRITHYHGLYDGFAGRKPIENE